LTFLDALVILNCVMVEGLGNSDIVKNIPINQAGVVRPGFNPEANARILFRNIVKEVQKINLITPLTERLGGVGDRFLEAKAIKKLSPYEKSLIINKTQEIFNAEKPRYLTRQERIAVGDFVKSLIETVALEQTGKIAEKMRLTTVSPRHAIEAASTSQDTMKMFFRSLAGLLENTYIQYPGENIFPDVDHSLAELFEEDLNLRPVDKEKNKNPLQEILIRTLRVADDHFKLEKDYHEQSSFNMVLGALNNLRGRGDDQSRYEELGGLLAEANGITLERGFAKELEKLLKAYQIVQPARKFQDTAYPYLNTLALEVATDKIRNPV
jgi:hypothetical protein